MRERFYTKVAVKKVAVGQVLRYCRGYLRTREAYRSDHEDFFWLEAQLRTKKWSELAARRNTTLPRLKGGCATKKTEMVEQRLALDNDAKLKSWDSLKLKIRAT